MSYIVLQYMFIVLHIEVAHKMNKIYNCKKACCLTAFYI